MLTHCSVTVLFLWVLGVVLETIAVVVRCHCVVALMRSSNMVVVCLSEPLIRRMSSANLRLASRSCSMSLFPWLSLLHVSDVGFMMDCKRVLNRSVLGGSPCLEYVQLLTSVCTLAGCLS